MIPDRLQLNAQTLIVVTDRVSGIVHAIRVYITGLRTSDEESLQDLVNEQLIAVMRRLAQSPRHGGPDIGLRRVDNAVFQGALREYLEAWQRVERPTIRGEWNVEVPIRIHRLWETEERDPVQANVIRQITIDERRQPPPPPGVIDQAHERIDEVLDAVEAECGGEDPISRMIRRWRNDHIDAAQSRYLDEMTARSYAHMSDAQPATVFTHSLDIRVTFRNRITTETSCDLRVAALREIIPNGINRANRFVADQERVLAQGGQIQPTFVPGRVHDLRDFIREQRGRLGSVYHEFEVDRGPCEWQWINYYDLFSTGS